MKILNYGSYLGAIGALVNEITQDDFDDVVENLKKEWKS